MRISDWSSDVCSSDLHDLRLTGTHLGCEHGVCGACTVLVEGRSARSCLMLAVQADGLSVTTVEGLSRDGDLHPLQQAFIDHHGLPRGFCTPGFLMSRTELTDANPGPTEYEASDAMSGGAGKRHVGQAGGSKCGK